MAFTDFGSFNALQKKIFSAKVLQMGRDGTILFNPKQGLASKSTNSCIQLITELTKTERGDKVIMPLVNDLVSDGVAGDNDQDGHEESLIAQDLEITIDMLSHAVRNKGVMSEQRTVIRFRSTAREKLGNWRAQKREEIGFLVLAGRSFTYKLDMTARPSSSQLPALAFANDVTAPSANRVVFPGSVTTTAGLSAANKMSWNVLLQAKTKAKRANIKPIYHEGRETYVTMISPEQGRDLKQDPDYIAITKDAGSRGAKNPLFSGAIAMVDGLVIYEHNKVPTNRADTTGWGAGNDVMGAQALLLGAQAMGVAEVGSSEWAEDKQKDYGRKPGIAYSSIMGFKKPVFEDPQTLTEEDFSVLSIFTAAA
ncbi:N4-gp56 family major capsid protein [Roseospira marina]|uniref:N4-gp56 family major capsid protein n=1 Tax=Roseospira marina TaxID=140057 RepID=A0A5M6IBD6_9PROT|nr:N4-gp56 family major capsid protein [Roseospira marina]KAA5605432.1 N4-gp56 family major capsid protein [Roseospira marina]MBB4314573.1 N4-gp56 family major capsid protein [Roseospira marina]MBB5088865.1 N4-gp56 family major capsid protein [Roseospira marina]